LPLGETLDSDSGLGEDWRAVSMSEASPEPFANPVVPSPEPDPKPGPDKAWPLPAPPGVLAVVSGVRGKTAAVPRSLRS